MDEWNTPTAVLDPFADAEELPINSVKDFIHIRMQQRSGKKSLTTVQGLTTEDLARGLNKDLAKLAKKAEKDKNGTKEITEEDLGLEKLLKDLKKSLCCNGHVAVDVDLGKIILLQGDQRKKVSKFLVANNFAARDRIKLHGF